MMLVFLGALCGFALTGDLFNLFVFFELMSVSAYAITAYRIEESAPLQGALTFAVSNSVGAVFILFGIGLLYGRTGALNLAQVGQALAGAPADGLVICSFALICAGFFVKAAIVPFHFWLSDAYAVAPTPACVVFSGVMSDLGVYAVARIYWTVFAGPMSVHAGTLRAILIGAGCLTALVAGVMCLAQLHLKRLLAFVTISQVGVVLIGVGLLSPTGLAGAALFAGADGLLRAGLFIFFGAVLHRLGEIDEGNLCGRGAELPWPAAALFVAAALGLAALPPLGAFVGKGLLDQGLEEAGYGWAVGVVVAATVLTAGALLRAAGRIFLGWSPLPPRQFSRWREAEETSGAHGFTPPVMILAGGTLTVLGLVLGLTPGIVDGVQGAAARFTDRAAYATAVLRGGGVQPSAETTSLGLSAVLVGLASTAGALLLGAITLARPRNPLPIAVARPVELAFFRLRRLHSGQVGDYVAWLVVGVAAFGGLLAWGLG